MRLQIHKAELEMRWMRRGAQVPPGHALRPFLTAHTRPRSKLMLRTVSNVVWQRVVVLHSGYVCGPVVSGKRVLTPLPVPGGAVLTVSLDCSTIQLEWF